MAGLDSAIQARRPTNCAVLFALSRSPARNQRDRSSRDGRVNSRIKSGDGHDVGGSGPMTQDSAATRKALNPWVKFTLELGPLVLFFAANAKPALFGWLVNGFLPQALPPDKVGMLTATAVLMIAAVATISLSWILTRRLAVVPVVTAVFVLVFGTLTLLLQDKTFIEAKLTIIYCLFGGALLGSMLLGKLVLPIVLDMAIHIDKDGWRKLTLRWGLFFFALAALNEVLRHYLTWDQWVTFKSFGVLPLTLIFAVAQTPLILRHETKRDAFADEM
ncbi:MAG: septation protein A [Roseiarcus sp.]|uniref:septation protein A n=1 Tax=Roseiarcus sp. TaxID=1969460 RepID=UPI003C233DFD